MIGLIHSPESSMASRWGDAIKTRPIECFFCGPDEPISLLSNTFACLRSTFPVHFTTSAVVFHPNDPAILLVKHRKYQKWVYPGGHADGDWNFLNSALREVQEETGLHSISYNCADGLPAFFAKFEIPSFASEPEHHHIDATYLFWAEPGFEIEISDESTDIRWFSFAEISDGDTHLPPETKFLCLQAIRMAGYRP